MLRKGDGESRPTALALTYSGSNFLASGTGAPTFTTALAAMADDDYEFVAMPFNDSTSLSTWEGEYGFGDTGRWGFLRQQYGHVFSAKRDTYANLMTFGPNRSIR